MVQRTPVLPGTSGARLRSVSSQLKALKHSVKSLNTDHASLYADRLKDEIPSGYLGLIAVPRHDHFGAIRIPGAIAAWKEASHWDLLTGIRGLRVNNLFKPEDFHMEDRTIEAFVELERRQGVPDSHKSEQNPVRVFPVRAAVGPDPALSEGEFLLDLASHIWLLTTHPDWREEHEIVFLCDGERFKPLEPRALIVGYRRLQRAVNFSSLEKTEGIVLVGKIPD